VIFASDSSDKAIKTTVSIGVVTVAQGAAVEAAAVISAADKNLYEAKSGGRNKVVCSLIR
jgi:diguanylate cyclase (GGDEF)-like protein